MDIITRSDLAAYLRDSDVYSDAGAGIIIELANGLVSDVTGETTITSKIRAITLEAAGRAWRNPEGYSSETIDDYTYRRPEDARRAGVYLTDTEMDELSGRSRTAKVGWLA